MLMLCAAGLAILVSISSARTVVAWSLSQTNPPGNWIRAAQWEPTNADWHCDLGIYYSVLNNDPVSAIPELEASVRLNPYRANCWTALGDAYGHSGDLWNERRTLETALQIQPNDARLALQAATIYANSNEVQRALPLYRIAIEKHPSWTDEIIRHAWFHQPDVQQLLASAVPTSPAAKFALLRLLVERQQWGAAAQVWQNVIQGNDRFRSKDALFYIDSLLAQGDVDTATRSWRQLSVRDPKLSETTPSGNLIMNAGFERDILNGGFGWIYQRVDGVDVSVDTSEFHSGVRSLALNFDAEGIGTAGLKQFVVVQPSARYSFTTWIRADSVETVSGPRFALTDAKTRSQLFSSEDVLGSFPWRLLTGEFTTGPDTHLLELSVVRNPINGRIRGKVWIDDLELVRH